MTREPFNDWLRQRRKSLELSYEDCIERINREYGTSYGPVTWRQWEQRYNEDTPRDRARKVAHALQIPEAEVFTAAGLLMDTDAQPALPPQADAMYRALNEERRYIVEALIKILHDQQKAG